MKRMRRVVLERKLEQARRLALEPTDPLTRERLAQIIEELEFQLQDQWKSPSPPADPDRADPRNEEPRDIAERSRELRAPFVFVARSS
jgi:hypothetical protein